MASRLPADGEFRLDAVTLPRGRRVVAEEGDGHAVAWATVQAVPEAGRAWSVLSERHSETGLVPVLLTDDADEFFMSPADVAEIDHLDAAQVLRTFWDEAHLHDDDDPVREPPWDTPLSREFLGLPDQGIDLGDIFGAIFRVATDPAAEAELQRSSELDRRNADRPPPDLRAAPPDADATKDQPTRFPGLAQPVHERLSSAELALALELLAPARIALVPANRPADVLAIVGWSTFDEFYEPFPVANSVWIGAVLRSWEERFGARLLNVGPGAQIQLLVERPPRTKDAALQVAAEHSIFCDECAGRGLREIPAIAPALISAPIWTFWWD